MNKLLRKKELRLVLVRHGRTEWNARGKFLGQYDIPMDKHGMGQVTSLAKKLKDKKIDLIYTSDLQRASETTVAINQYHNCTVAQTPELREIDFGEWTGKTYEEIKNCDPQKLSAWETDRINTIIPGGESLIQLSNRVNQVLKTFINEYPEKTLLISSHGGPLQVMICLALGFTLDNYWRFVISHASVSDLQIYTGGAVIHSLNDTCHLE